MVVKFLCNRGSLINYTSHIIFNLIFGEKNMQGATIRQAFCRYFNAQGHQILASSSLVPEGDSTLLFSNSGMLQFKDVFAGQRQITASRVVTVQKCLRAGGKHNDLENVGYTSRHHTFFEMLGNFSFGDYFKTEAIGYAWQFITEVLQIPASRLWVTVHEKDQESATVWNQVGIPSGRILKLGEHDNFWSMGDVGPCGYCSEIFYDHGPAISGGLPGTADAEGARFVEIWNLVFIEYNRNSDGTLMALSTRGVDTGMGLERITAVMQGVSDNYHTDIFLPILTAIGTVAGLSKAEAVASSAVRVIADHLRAMVFLIADGVMPGNEDRNYVLRRIIRRALRYGYKVEIKTNLLVPLIPILLEQMGECYPQLQKSAEHIARVIRAEEDQFRQTLERGMVLLQKATKELTKELNGGMIGGDLVFKLYDTYGFPVDLTADYARENNLTIDMDAFNKAMQAQRERARTANRFALATELQLDVGTDFVGYQEDRSLSRIVRLLCFDDENQKKLVEVDELQEGEAGVVILEQTPFYAEAGGQVGDTGQILAENAEFVVTDTQKNPPAFLHYGRVSKGSLKADLQVQAVIDVERRHKIRCNHSATHLLNAALRLVLGEHIEQRGSMVADDRLRFDFHHPRKVSQVEIQRVETLVNAQIQSNSVITTRIMPLEQARQLGALSLVGEKYAAEVRVLAMGTDFSTELCAGTHASRTGDIGLFRITHESSIAEGTRRMEAVTGAKVLENIHLDASMLGELQQLLQVAKTDLRTRVKLLLKTHKDMEKSIHQLQQKLAIQGHADLNQSIQEHKGVKLIARQVENMDAKAMLMTVDSFKQKFASAVIILATINSGKVNLVVGVTANLVDRISASDIFQHVGGQLGARGGGKPTLARGGGGRPDNLEPALAGVFAYLRQQLS